MDEVKRRLVVDYGTMQRDAEGNAVYVILPENVDVTQFWEYAKFCYRKYADHQNVWILYKHSSDMDSKEFNRLIEGVISEAKERGIETLTPNELARLKGYVR